MITANNIETAWAEVNERIGAYNQLYKMFLEQKLKSLELDGVAIRKSDGKRGKILIVGDGRSVKRPYTVEFHPYTSTGKVSVNQSGYNLQFDNDRLDQVLIANYEKGE